MQVNVHDAAPGTVELEVQIDQDQFGQTLKDVLDQIARSATLPGFRKGKAPRAMVERSVDRTAVRARAIERVLPSAYKEALEQSGLNPLTDPEVEILSQDEDADLRFKMIVHKHPEITPGPIDGMELTLYETAVTDADVDNEIASVVEQHTVYDSEPEFVAQKGDIVVADVEVFLDDEPVPDANDLLEITVGEYAQTPAVDDELIGLKAGDVKDIPVTYPTEFVTEELAGKDVVWRARIDEVRRKQAPELDDDFVRELAGAESIAAYREMVRSQLEQLARDQDEESLRTQALDKLLASSSIVFPHILVDQELEGRVQRLERQLQRTRHSIDEFASNQGITRAELIAQLHDQAEVDVTEYLLLLRVASAEGIEITPEEVDAQIEREGAERGSRPAVIEIEKKNETRRSGVRYEMTKRRILDRIVERAHVERHGPSVDRQSESAQAGSAPGDETSRDETPMEKASEEKASEEKASEEKAPTEG